MLVIIDFITVQTAQEVPRGFQFMNWKKALAKENVKKRQTYPCLSFNGQEGFGIDFSTLD